VFLLPEGWSMKATVLGTDHYDNQGIVRVQVLKKSEYLHELKLI